MSNSSFDDATAILNGQRKTESNQTQFSRNFTLFDQFIYNYTRSTLNPGLDANNQNAEVVNINYRAEVVNVIANNSAIKNYTSYNATTSTPQDAASAVVFRQLDGYVLEVQQNPFDVTKVVVEYKQNITDYFAGVNGNVILPTDNSGNNAFPPNGIRFSNFTLTRNSTRTSTTAGDLIFFYSTNSSIDTTFQNAPQSGNVRRL